MPFTDRKLTVSVAISWGLTLWALLLAPDWGAHTEGRPYNSDKLRHYEANSLLYKGLVFGTANC
jgi:hypothetical protein